MMTVQQFGDCFQTTANKLCVSKQKTNNLIAEQYVQIMHRMGPYKLLPRTINDLACQASVQLSHDERICVAADVDASSAMSRASRIISAISGTSSHTCMFLLGRDLFQVTAQLYISRYRLTIENANIPVCLSICLRLCDVQILQIYIKRKQIVPVQKCTSP